MIPGHCIIKIIKKFLIIISLLSTAAYSAEEIDFTGIWKGDCSDFYGVQIKPIDKLLYSVSFCGRYDCFEAGTWKPNTPIVGDPNYKIYSSEKLGIGAKGNVENYSIYLKCTSDPIWVGEEKPVVKPQELSECLFKRSDNNEPVLIAFITDIRKTTQFSVRSESKTTIVGSFRPLAVLSGITLSETQGSEIYEGQLFWQITDPSINPVALTTVGSFLDHMNTDHCVYFGEIDNSDLPKWTLLSSQPLPDVFRAPTDIDRERFYQLNTACVHQGDYPSDKAPPCVRPKLLAISDFNKNGSDEYWATQPYLWDTGLTVWENTGKLNRLFSVCVGCSD